MAIFGGLSARGGNFGEAKMAHGGKIWGRKREAAGYTVRVSPHQCWLTGEPRGKIYAPD
jgi:hypothetical protein